MQRAILVLTVVLTLLVGPIFSVLADAPQGGVITDCRYSYDTQFPGGTGTGEIAERFSTLRSSPGAFSTTAVLAEATFNVLSQECLGGFSWLQIEYTSGTACDMDYYYGYYGYWGECDDEYDAAGLTGYALESQLYFDGTYGPGRWLIAAAQPS